MDVAEKHRILAEQMVKFRAWSYEQLAARIGTTPHLDIVEGTASDGTPYFMDFDVFWDDRPNGNVRVMGNFWGQQGRKLLGFLPIFRPDLSDDFIMRPDGGFVGDDFAAGN